MSAGDVLLEARGLHAWYGSSHVLHGVDLAIDRGETVGLLGRNGMGKTTLIRSIIGHVRSREGSMHGGGDVSRRSPMRSRASAWPTCPRDAASFPISRCARTS